MKPIYTPTLPQHPLITAWYTPAQTKLVDEVFIAEVDTRAPVIAALVRQADVTVIHELLNLFYWDAPPHDSSPNGHYIRMVLRCIGAPAVAPALDFFRRYNHPKLIEQALITLLGVLQVNDAAPDLLAILATPIDDWRRVLAAFALADIGDTRAVPILATLVEQRVPDFWRFAVALGRLRHPDGFDALYRCLLDPSPDRVRRTVCRQGAAWALGLQGDPQAVPTLLRQLDDPAPNVRFNTCVALGQIGDGRAIQALKGLHEDSAATDEGERVGWAAQLASGRLTNQWDIELLQTIAARTNDPQLHAWSTRGMGAVGGATMERLLLEMTDHAYFPWRLHAVDALGEMGAVRALKPLTVIAETDVGVTLEGRSIAAAARTAIAQIRFLNERDS